MKFIDNVTDKVEYEHINRTILNGNITNRYLIFSKGSYGAINDDDTSFHGYYIVIFFFIYIYPSIRLVYI